MKAVSKSFVVDVLNFVVFVCLAGTGILMRYVLPPGSGRGRGGGWGYHGGREVLTWLGMDRHEWGEIHFWLAVAMVVLIVVHLIQHGRWIACRFQRTPKECECNGS